MRIFGIILFLCLGYVSACTFTYDYNGTQFLCKDKECPAGFKCSSGHCISDKTVTCGSDDNCPAGQRCNGNICVTGSKKDGGSTETKPECTTNANCGVGGYCIESVCSHGSQGERCEETLQCQTNHVCQTLGNTKACLKQCSDNGACQTQETCRPSITGGDSVCVPSCEPLIQKGCLPTEVCILSKGRGYCRVRKGGQPVGLTCIQATDCELHLYCRPVKGFPNFNRCAQICQTGQGGICAPAQSCVPLPPQDQPFGFCQPLPPPKGKKDDVCGGDIQCEAGLKCVSSKCIPSAP